MIKRTMRKGRGLGFALAAATLAAVLLTELPALAIVGTLTNVSWAVSNNQTGKTAVTYTFQLTTATAATVGSVQATVPAGTAGTPGVGTVYGIGAGTASLTGTTLKYTVTAPASIAAGIPIYIEFTSVTNTGTAGTYTSAVSTYDTTGAVQIDTATSPSVTFGAGSTSVTVQVAKSLTFSNDTSSFTLQMDPSLAALSDITKVVTLTVKTNAGSGYTLSAQDAGLSKSSPSYTIPAVSTGTSTGVASASFGANKVGVQATLTVGGGSGAALQGALATAGNYVGYTTSGQNFVSATGPTGSTGDTLALTNRVKIDYSTPAGTYTDTLTYVVTPSY